MASHETGVAIPVSSRIPHHLSTRSPRSSLDSSPRTPTSPFLHNLSNRFRKSSNASNFSNASELPPQVANTEDSTESVQSAKRFVLSVVRNDWEWPTPLPPTASGGQNITHAELKQETILSQRDPVGWRTRHEGASDLDLDLSPVKVTGRKKSKRNSDPYRFESPDAIANVIQEQRFKRRRANAEEMTWNEGLRTWSDRRDAWTAAQAHRPKKRSSDTHTQGNKSSPMHACRKDSVSSEEDGVNDTTSPMVNGTHQESGRQMLTGHDITDTNDTTEDDSLNGPYLPIYPPLFPTSHTLRARIKPAAYPTIYSKVVVQSLTPNVPIPLTHMIGALVDGWKTEGNWPPQTLADQQHAALLKRTKGEKKGETAFHKWRRERDVERLQQNYMFGDELAGPLVEEAEEEHEKKGFRRSISGAVKKVLGMGHNEVEEDGGLAKLGLSFGNHEDGLLHESQQVANDNVVLNRALLEGEKG